jgi:DNA invertase Pin-like site-specific DNA recombinase
MRIGYARVSTQDQRLDLQHEALSRSGCDKTFEDTISGKVSNRPGLKRTLDILRKGDTLVVWKLDRLGRSVKQLVDLVCHFEEEGINLVSLTDSIDTSTPAGRFFFHVMASLAEMERELAVERTRAGLRTARLKGRVGGRRRLMTESKVSAAQELLRSGRSPRDVAADLGVSLATLYRWVPADDRLNAPQPSVPLPSNDADNLV